MDSRVTRAGALAKLGGLLAALAAGGWKVHSSEGAGPAAVESGAVACVLTPEQTEGPYYIAKEKVRRNITEGRPGTPLLLHLAVVNASTCKPIKGATVDIWHCDAGGVYSGFGQGSSSRTFMRGIQKTGAKGIAIFRTVYPGWYTGRTVHIHVKVHLGGRVVHTGQLYFRDALTDAVYKAAPYTSRPGRDTRNANDSVYRNGGRKSLLAVRRQGSGYFGMITMGVHRS
jgi:protocatechuate 3,4-dioxygenase beta subunit